MSHPFENDPIYKIQIANDLVELVKEHIPLQLKGDNWRGHCPFCDDQKFMLHVSPRKQLYKCFACFKAGNVFSFVQDMDNLSFKDAANKLAKRAGLPEIYPNNTHNKENK